MSNQADEQQLTHDEKIAWMTKWATKHGLVLNLAGECGFGRECVGVLFHDNYPDYEWCNEETWEREDPNGEVWTPPDAYHKHPCVAVLGRGEYAESQLYDWLKWFDANGFVFETGEQKMDPRLGMIGLLMGKNRFQRLVRKAVA
jgi:hypothetical protein